jgi:Domain of unknown function DUF83
MPLIAYLVHRNPGILGAIMDTNNSITAAVFIAFLKCPTKAHLLAIGEPAPTAFFTDIEARISSRYKSAVRPTLRVGTDVTEPLDFKDLWSSRHEAIARHVDCETTAYNVAPPSREPGGCQSRESTPSGTFVPVLFSPWDKPDVSSSLAVCFGALALSQVTGILATTGTVIYGEEHRRKTVKIADHTVRTRQTIDAILATCNSREPPPLVLNRHCAVCDFQPRCRGLAIDRDDLSLLTAMTGKERAKFNSKGIFSIKHLSYGYPLRHLHTHATANANAAFQEFLAGRKWRIGFKNWRRGRDSPPRVRSHIARATVDQLTQWKLRQGKARRFEPAGRSALCYPFNRLLVRIVQLIESDIAAEEARAGVSDRSDVMLARSLLERRENLNMTIAVLQQRLTEQHEETSAAA